MSIGDDEGRNERNNPLLYYSKSRRVDRLPLAGRLFHDRSRVLRCSTGIRGAAARRPSCECSCRSTATATWGLLLSSAPPFFPASRPTPLESRPETSDQLRDDADDQQFHSRSPIPRGQPEWAPSRGAPPRWAPCTGVSRRGRLARGQTAGCRRAISPARPHDAREGARRAQGRSAACRRRRRA